MRLTKKIIVIGGLAVFASTAFWPLSVQIASAESCPTIDGVQTIPAGIGVAADKCIDKNTGYLYNYSGQRVDLRGSATTGSNEDFGCTVGTAFSNCIAAMVYWIGPGIGGYVAYIGAYFFSVIVQLSLQSTAYALQFLTDGWTVVRDVANMAFIFILIYIAFEIMLGAETTGTMRRLAWVVIIALIVNFSFFLTRVVIDAGNLVAVQLYNAIPVPQGTPPIGPAKTKDLSASIMQAVGAQNLYGAKSFEKAREATGGTMSGLILFSLVSLSFAAILYALFFTFIQVGVKFLMRIVVLWFVIISSPVALVAKTLKQTESFYKMWQDYLIKFSFYPAIFLFMFLLLTTFIGQMMQGQQGDFLSNLYNVASPAQTYTDVGAKIAEVFIRMAFVMALLYVGLKVADWVVQEGTGLATKITGFASRAAFGTTAFAGRFGIGGLGHALATSHRLANSESAAGQALWRAGSFLSKRSFDVRAIPGVRQGLGTLGGDVLRGQKIDVGAAGGRGGWRATEEKMEKWAKSFPETAEKERDELNKKMGEIEFRENQKRLGVLNSYNIEETEKRMDEIDKRKAELDARVGIGAATAAEIDERRNLIAEKTGLEGHKTTAAAKEGKSWDDLKAEQTVFAERVKNASPALVASLKAADVEGIVKQLTESHIKAVKESAKFMAAEKERIEQKWHNENKNAPKQMVLKELEVLDKIHDDLRSVGVTLRKIKDRASTTPAGKLVISLKVAEDTLKDLGAEQERQDRRRDAAARGTDDHKKASAALREINRAIKRHEKIVEELKKVPEKVGDREAPAEFEHKFS